MKAKKSFGQHFLTNEAMAKKIAQSLLCSESVQRVLEIGPGKGVLTKYLAEMYPELKVVEADKDMIDYLVVHRVVQPEQVLFMDFLKLNLSKVFDGEPFCMIGNYPYNISSQILFKMVQYRDFVPEMVGMFQKEVADRVIAPPGSKTYGVISVLVQAYYSGSLVMNVAPGNFNPPPKVQSAVIRLLRKENFRLECDEKLFRTIVKSTFQQRRKMLRNTLKPLVTDAGILEDTFFNSRPEQLSVEDFVILTNRIAPFTQNTRQDEP